jgi:hypothetical protein
VSEGAPEAEELIRFGLKEGSPNRHPGMGTANRRFFFDNAMLEMLYVHDPAEAQSDPIRPAALWERSRYRETGASPFALIIRKTEANAELPFQTWDWVPPFLPAGAVLQAGYTVPAREPFLFLARVGPRAHPFPDDKPEPTDHPAGLKRISGARVTYRFQGPPSAPLAALERMGLVSFVDGPEPLLELTFDGGRRGESRDFRPGMPLVVRR